jgi:hypothetical protein
MTDGFGDGQVDFGDLMSAEEDSISAVCERSQCDAFAAEGLRDAPEPSLEADVSLGGGDAAHDLAALGAPEPWP